MPTHALKGALLAVLSAVGFGWLAIFARIVYAAGVDPITALALRFTVSGALMTALLLVRRESLPRGRVLAGLIGMGAIGYVGQSLGYFTALTMASTSLVALLLYLYPALVTIISAVALKERITPIRGVALVFAFIGTALTIGLDPRGTPAGIALAAGAALIYAGYIVVGGRVMRRAAPIPASTVIMLSAAAVFVTIAAARGPRLPESPEGWLGVAAMALLSTVIPVVAFLASVELIGPGNASLISTFEPVVTVGLAIALYGDTLDVPRIAGGALILAAVALLARRELRVPD